MGFYLFSWHTEEGFHRAFCCLPYYFLLCPRCCRNASLAPRGEFLHDRNQHPIIPAAPLHFPFVSLTISSPSITTTTTTTTLPSVTVCQLHSTAPSCLHIAWSKTTNWSFTACSLSAFLSLSHRSLPSSRFFYGCFLSSHSSPRDSSVRATIETAGRRGNEMTHWKMVLLAGNGIVTVTMRHSGEATCQRGFFWRLTFLKRWRLKHCLVALPLSQRFRVLTLCK